MVVPCLSTKKVVIRKNMIGLGCVVVYIGLVFVYVGGYVGMRLFKVVEDWGLFRNRIGGRFGLGLGLLKA